MHHYSENNAHVLLCLGDYVFIWMWCFLWICPTGAKATGRWETTSACSVIRSKGRLTSFPLTNHHSEPSVEGHREVRSMRREERTSVRVILMSRLSRLVFINLWDHCSYIFRAFLNQPYQAQASLRHIFFELPLLDSCF